MKKLTCNSKDLAARLKMAAKVINSKNSLPILGDFLVEGKRFRTVAFIEMPSHQL